ncbi:MAG: DUF3037 domain-containing protein [Bacteroidota bacterium]
MPDKHIYEYALIRLVPRVERGEYVNVGVILFSKRLKFLDMRVHLDEHRLTALFPDIDMEEIRNYLEVWDLICQGDPKGGEIAKLDKPERFRWLTAMRSTIIQNSRVHPGRCTEPEKVLERLFREYVL